MNSEILLNLISIGLAIYLIFWGLFRILVANFYGTFGIFMSVIALVFGSSIIIVRVWLFVKLGK